MYLPSLSATTLLLGLSWISDLAHADEPSFFKDEAFMKGDHGTYPTHKFKTSVIEPPRLNFEESFDRCDDGSYIFLSPRGNVASASFYILDHDGHLIWGPDHKYGQVYNFQVQQYKGEPYLFFWAGDDSVGGHGEGKYYMLDQHYEEHQKISAGDGLRGDLHAFFITEEQTAVYTGYRVVQADLTSMGKDMDSWIWESLFQELDIETGEVLFEWRASEHFPFEDSYVNPNQATHTNPWDFFHINMVDKDKEGNYLVSTRYGRCVLYISKDTGDILWQLGGKSNSFKDISREANAATIFLGQHDVHWVDGHDGITMFDNRADWFNKMEDESVGKRIHVDLEHMTAELVRDYRHPSHILSTSQGSMQTLPNGNILLGYGFNGVLTEFSPDGVMLCDAYFSTPKRFGSADVQSYRNLKYNWTGIPLTTPDLKVEDKVLYMSWLGSTKLRSWTIQDCNRADGIFESVQTTTKNGFETEFALKEGYRMRRYVRVIAVDQGGTQLSVSNPVQINPVEIWGEAPPGEDLIHHLEPDEQLKEEVSNGNPDSIPSQPTVATTQDDVEDVQILLVLGVLLMISAALVAWMTFGGGCIPWRRRGGKPTMNGGEKHYGGGGLGRYGDDGRWRRLWHRVRMQFLPGSRGRSWKYGHLPMAEEEDAVVGAAGPPIFANGEVEMRSSDEQ